MATYPVGLPVGYVTASIYDLIGDLAGGNADADDLPDAVDVSMSVEFLPTVKMLRYAGKGYRLRGYTASSTSVLTAPDGTGSYVLPSTDTPAHDGSTGWMWQARVNLVSAGGYSTQLTSGLFKLTSGQSVDLVTGLDVDGNPLLPIEAQSYSASALVQVTGGGGGGAVASVAGKTGAVTIASSDLTDVTATGQALIQAVSAAGARAAIGAGTSSLTLGTTGTTAMAGNAAVVKTVNGASPDGAGNVTIAAATDATTGAKGVVQLAGDLGGTAAAPTVPGLAGKAAAVHTHTAANISDATTEGRALLTGATLPALDVWQAADGSWPSRPTWTGRVQWVGYPGLSSTPAIGAGGATAGTDTYLMRT